NLCVNFRTMHGLLKAVRGINFSIGYGETIGIVGESGCGKSVTAHAILQLLPSYSKQDISGEILLENEDLLKKNDKALEQIRGKKIGMIFQDPMTALNPTMQIGAQIAEGVLQHQKISRREALQHACNLMESLGISDAAR